MDRYLPGDRPHVATPYLEPVEQQRTSPTPYIVEPGITYSVGPTDNEMLIATHAPEQSAERPAPSCVSTPGSISVAATVEAREPTPLPAARSTDSTTTFSLHTETASDREPPVQEALAPIIAATTLQPARETDYPVINAEEYTGPQLPPRWRNRAQDDGSYTAAGDYLSSIVPGIEVEPLSKDGSTAIVMQDGSLAYKVFRDPTRSYGRIENEMAALTVLHEEGITPKPIALLDTPKDRRYTADNTVIREPLFNGATPIPRYETTGDFPVIITEQRRIGPIDDLPLEARTSEFKRFAETAVKHDLQYHDCEIHHDKDTGHAIIVDVGEVKHASGVTINWRLIPGLSDVVAKSGYSEELLRQTYLVQDTLIRFLPKGLPRPSLVSVAKRLSEGGLDAVATLLTTPTNAARVTS